MIDLPVTMHPINSKDPGFTRLARRSDPATSQRAAAKSAEFADTHAGKIYFALLEKGALTAKELEPHTGLSVVQICRRTGLLVDSGLIRVVRENGQDVERGGLRVWEAV